MGEGLKGLPIHGIGRHSDVDTDTTAPALNQVLRWNGQEFVPSDPDADDEFTFLALTFGATGRSSVELIGSGTWVTSQAFTASWQQPPPDSATVAVSGGGSVGWPVGMTGPSCTASDAHSETVSYPSVNASRVFTLTGVLSGSPNAESTYTTFFRNQSRWGMSADNDIRSAANGADIIALPEADFVTTSYVLAEHTVALDPTPKWIYFCYPSRISGTPVFKINGFTTGFTYVGLDDVTNSAGYAEEFKVYQSPLQYDDTTSPSLTFEVS